MSLIAGEYFPVTVMGKLDDLGGTVYLVVQLPVTSSVQVDELNEPPTPPSLNVTFPTGVVGELDLSVTVALNVTCCDA